MASQNIVAHSGNLITIELDGKRFGTIRSLRANDDYSPEPLSGIGDIHTQEYVPTMARHTINVEYAILKAESMRDAGILDENGCAKLGGKEFDIVIYEKNPLGTPGQGGADQSACDTQVREVRKYRYCSYASGSVSVQAHQIVMSDAVFNARDVTGTAV
jgi:hypothetical protein